MADMPKQRASYRLTATAFRLIASLADRLGLSHTAVIELALRRLAHLEGIDPHAAPAPAPVDQDDAAE